MTPDPAAIEEPWLVLDAAAPDIADAGNRLECWSHVGGYADVYLHASTDDPSPMPTITRPGERLSAQARIEGREAFLEPVRQVLMHLLDGVAKGAPVVFAAPPAEFGANGCVAPTLMVVEALLPRRWSDALYVRGFTRDLGLFLDELRCHLIAVPRDMAAAVLEARRDAILLDERGTPAEGQQPSAAAASYADAVCDLASRDPGLLDPVLSRFERAAPDLFRLPADAGGILTLAKALSGGDDLEEGPLNELIGQYPQLLDPDDCPLLSESALFGVALSEPPAPHEAAVLEIERRAGVGAWSSTWEWDRCLEIAPRNAMEALLATGQWQQWRERARLAQTLLREAAVCWCGSRYWRRHEPRLEDWAQIVRDLAGPLSDSDHARMTDPARGASPFPPIPWFEGEQQADLEALAASGDGGRGHGERENGAAIPGTEQQARVELPAEDAGRSLVARAEREDSPLEVAHGVESSSPDTASAQDLGSTGLDKESSRVLKLWIAAILAAAVIGLTLGLIWNRL